MGELSKKKTGLLIVSLVFMWGLSWPIYKIALNDTPPLLFAGMRTLAGGVLLTLTLLPSFKKIRFRENWKIYCTSAVFNAFLFYGLQTIGLSYVPEGLFTVIVYVQPVLIGLLAWLWLGEAISAMKIIGLIIGFLGVGIISITGLSGHISPIGIVLALATAISWAIGTVYVKRVGTRVDALWLVAIQCVLGGLGMTILAGGIESWGHIVWNGPYLVGLIYGAIFGIPLSWVVFFTLIRSGDTSKVASFTFLVPMIAVFIGTLFLHEEFSIYLFVGLVLIVGSIYLVNRKVKITNKEQAAP